MIRVERAERGQRDRGAQSTRIGAGQDRAAPEKLGNRGILALAHSGRLQRKARLSQPGDPAEYEADRAADAVATGRAPENWRLAGLGADAGAIQRIATAEEELAATLGLEGSLAAPAATSPAAAAPENQDAAAILPGLYGGRPLDPQTRDLMETRFGESFGDVRVHTGQRAGDLADRLRARAFTIGEDIVFAEGEFAPGTGAGRHLLAHELAHVVQQRRAHGSVAGEGARERDADDAAREAASGGTPRIRERAAPDAVQKQSRSPDEEAMLDELLQLEARAQNSTLSAADQARREKLRDELGRRDAARRGEDPDTGRTPQPQPPSPQIGPPPPPQTGPAEHSKHPHDFRVTVKDNELIATLNGKRVASGWIDNNVGVAVEENYSDDPLHYYVTLWIDGEHQVTHDPGAISAFREIAEDVNFYIRRTARSLQEHPEPRIVPSRPPTPRAPATPPIKKPPPRIVVPPQSAVYPEQPFLESDPRPPEAYVTPRVQNLRDHLRGDESDVEDLAIELSIPELRSLKFDERLALLRRIADNWFVGDDKERTLNELIDTTPEPDAARLLSALRADNAALLRRLDQVIDGEEYIQLHEALRRLYLRSMTPGQLLSQIAASREKGTVWADPGLIDFFKGGRVTYQITQSDDGRLHVRRWISAPIPGAEMRLPDLDLDPFELVPVYFKYGEDVLGGAKGSVVYMPAVNLLLLENKQFKQDMELAANVGMVFGGGAGILRATGRLALALAIAELTVGAANITISNYHSQLEKTPEGAAFLRSWEIVNLLFATYSIGRTVRSAPQALRELRDAYRAFRAAAQGTVEPVVLARIEQDMARVMHDTGEVEMAATEAHGDIGEPPSRPGPFDIPDEEFVDPGPLVERTATPSAGELSRTIDERLARSKVFARWIGPKQAAGKTAAKLGISVLSDEEYVKFRARLLEGKINPGTRKPFTEQERLNYARLSRGFVDPTTGRATFPASRFEPGNEIHEGLHQLQSAEFRALGRNVSEGATEYFTMIIMQEQSIPRSYLKYQNLRPLVFDMAQVAGFDNVADAYFNGDLSKVRAAFEGHRPGLWNEWLKLCRENKLAEARALLAPFHPD